MRQLRDFLPYRSDEKHAEPVSKAPDAKTIFFLFSKIISQQYGQRGLVLIRPVAYQNQVLVVRVASPLWAQEVIIMASELCLQLNQALEASLVEKIEVQRGNTRE